MIDQEQDKEFRNVNSLIASCCVAGALVSAVLAYQINKLERRVKQMESNLTITLDQVGQSVGLLKLHLQVNHKVNIAAITNGFTPAESSNFWWAIKEIQKDPNSRLTE